MAVEVPGVPKVAAECSTIIFFGNNDIPISKDSNIQAEPVVGARKTCLCNPIPISASVRRFQWKNDLDSRNLGWEKCQNFASQL